MGRHGNEEDEDDEDYLVEEVDRSEGGVDKEKKVVKVEDHKKEVVKEVSDKKKLGKVQVRRKRDCRVVIPEREISWARKALKCGGKVRIRQPSEVKSPEVKKPEVKTPEVKAPEVQKPVSEEEKKKRKAEEIVKSEPKFIKVEPKNISLKRKRSSVDGSNVVKAKAAKRDARRTSKDLNRSLGAEVRLPDLAYHQFWGHKIRKRFKRLVTDGVAECQPFEKEKKCLKCGRAVGTPLEMMKHIREEHLKKE